MVKKSSPMPVDLAVGRKRQELKVPMHPVVSDFSLVHCVCYSFERQADSTVLRNIRLLKRTPFDANLKGARLIRCEASEGRFGL